MFAAVVTPVRALLALVFVSLALVPAAIEAQTRLRTTLTAMPAPTGVTASWSANGVQLAWQPVSIAVEYHVLRGPDATTPGSQIARLRPDVLAYLDAGFNSAAGYQIVAIDAMGRQGASAIVPYTPPATMVTGVTTGTLATRPIGTISSGGISTLSQTSAAVPVIADFSGVAAPDIMVYLGDTVRVTGTGLDGLTSVALISATRVSSYSPWYANPVSPPTPVTPFNASATGFSFVASAPIPSYGNQKYPFVIVVSKSAGVDTGNGAVHIGHRPTPKKILSVAQTAIRSGSRVRITGIGLRDVIGGYFGPGVYGSTTNPMLSAMNRTDTYVELVTTPDCKQEGILMLHEPGMAGSSPTLITPDTVIRVACYSGTPEGKIDGDVNGVVYISNGTTDVSIRGTNLKAVTAVVDQMGRKYPVTYSSVGTGTSGFTEWVRFKVGSNFTPGGALGLTLENVLTDPVVNGTVIGSVRMLTPATWNWIGPAWAEPGMKVRISGHYLKNSAMPTVTVGGIPAQVLTADPLNVEFRVPANATAGPVALTNEGGTVTMSGQFNGSNGLPHPGFFIVSGPTTVTSITPPRTPVATGDTIVVQGQNLARAFGICVPSAQGGQPLTIQRVQTPGGMGYNTSNTEMKVVFHFQPSQVQSGAPIQVYRPTSPPGDFLAADYACHPQTGGAVWP
ncbi:MAG TPA: hypothetical protein VJ672_06470 [Gemmatimonadaceae bacterium]|nr:hypothetical protein [Gemmatimonadaceae bacterium]